MKRIITILLALLFLLPSCAAEKKIPAFEAYPITLSGTVTHNGNSYAVTAVIQENSDLDISIDSPEALTGYRFKVDNSGIWVYYDSMQIELKHGSFDIPFTLLPEMLSVSREEFEYFRTEEENRVYYYKNDGCTTVIYVKRTDDMPCRIEYTKNDNTVILDIESFITQ